MNLKDSWNTSNHNLNYLPQVISFQRCIPCIEIRELNLQALIQHRENSAAARIVLPAIADLAAPLSPQSFAKPEFMGPQNRCDANLPDSIINDFKVLLECTQDATHGMAIYSGMKEFMKHKSRNKTYISYEHLHPIEICTYYGL
jgi:hypothetical protein